MEITMEIRAAESFDLNVNEQHKKCPLINQGKTWTLDQIYETSSDTSYSQFF